jgi:hypothetical protein
MRQLSRGSQSEETFLFFCRVSSSGWNSPLFEKYFLIIYFSQLLKTAMIIIILQYYIENCKITSLFLLVFQALVGIRLNFIEKMSSL